jgi:tetratricopeptide (TPR) repeat protein
MLVTVMLVLAQIHFIRKNYGRSLDLYKKILATAKTLPPKGRLGMGYSFFFLGKYEMARACFHRLLQLEPNCVEALIGIATVHDR